MNFFFNFVKLVYYASIFLESQSLLNFLESHHNFLRCAKSIFGRIEAAIALLKMTVFTILARPFITIINSGLSKLAAFCCFLIIVLFESC